jgi:hypothetical protein
MAHVDNLYTGSMSLRSSAEWWRNIVVVCIHWGEWPKHVWLTPSTRSQAPLTEEFFFRACMCPLLLKSGWSATKITVACPLFFGACNAEALTPPTPHPQRCIPQV